MHAMTEANLHNAYAGESMAHMRYKIFAEVAEKEGFKNVARLFRAIAQAEQVHATNHARKMPRKGAPMAGEAPFGIGTTSENLQFGIDGETFEIEEMYPVYREVAKFQNERLALQSFDYAWNTEKVHQKMFVEAKSNVDSGKDYKPGNVWVCKVCGFTGEGEAPDTCPLCGAKKDQMENFP
jgi:rubrerythrin